MNSSIFLQRLVDAIQKCNRTVLGLGVLAGTLLRIESTKKINGENRSGGAMFPYLTDETLFLFVGERVTQKDEIEIGCQKMTDSITATPNPSNP